jgi:hypothetical protein
VEPAIATGDQPKEAIMERKPRHGRWLTGGRFNRSSAEPNAASPGGSAACTSPLRAFLGRLASKRRAGSVVVLSTLLSLTGVGTASADGAFPSHQYLVTARSAGYWGSYVWATPFDVQADQRAGTSVLVNGNQVSYGDQYVYYRIHVYSNYYRSWKVSAWKRILNGQASGIPAEEQDSYGCWHQADGTAAASDLGAGANAAVYQSDAKGWFYVYTETYWDPFGSPYRCGGPHAGGVDHLEAIGWRWAY